MKKLFLLLTMSSIGLAATAQENRSMMFGSANMMNSNVQAQQLNKTKPHRATAAHSSNVAAKTTTVLTQRWYNYSEYIDTFFAAGLSGQVNSLAVMPLWNDTSGQLVFTSGLAHNTLVSCGSIFQPQASGFNDPQYFAGEMQLTNQAYLVDTIDVSGLYLFNPSKMSVVDTLTFTFTQGQPDVTGDDILRGTFKGAAAATLLSNYGLGASDSVVMALMQYDSVTNKAAGTSAYSFQIFLTSADWGDTLSNGIFLKRIKLPVAYNVTANNMVGVSMSFKSGDATFIANDTLNNQYNQFRPLYSFAGTSASPAFGPYWHGDYNAGQFKTLPNFSNGWGNVYVPMYAWTAGSGASNRQQSEMGFHVACTTCDKIVNVATVVNTIKDINAFPNPASSEVSIGYVLNASSEVSIELTNTFGQVVATKSLGHSANGLTTFNTANLAAGVYFYTVIANGERTTGRVAIAH